MSYDLLMQMVFSVLGGLGLFLVGMKQMSEGMQAIAGDRLRRMIGAVTDNRLVACGVGAGVTSLIQSSSVTTVMVVGIVNAGVMNLRQAIGVIMGADIGTTITAWLVALKISEYGLAFIGVSALFYLFSKNDRIRYSAMMVLGIGFVFFGLQLMKQGFMPLREMEGFINVLAAFQPDTYWGVLKCVLVGSFVTAVIQSSSATVAITMTLASTGAISYETAVALVLGENIGTTITAWLASLGANTNAKRAAYAHISIKVFGVLFMIPLFYVYVAFLNNFLDAGTPVAARIAFAHTGFNITIVSLFIPFVGYIARFVTFLVPTKTKKEKTHLTYLNMRIYDAPSMNMEQSLSEIKKMGRGTRKMMDWLSAVIEDPERGRNLKEKIFKRERLYDQIQKEIVEYIGMLMHGSLPQDVGHEVRMQIRIADEYESISDEIVTILKLILRLHSSELRMTKHDNKEVRHLHDKVAAYLDEINESVQDGNDEIILAAQLNAGSIRHSIKNARSGHLTQLSSRQTTPVVSLIYMDILSAYRRIKDHILNIAEVMAGEK